MVGVSSRTSLLTSVLALALAIPLVPSAAAAPVVYFEDDFDDGAIDGSKWAETLLVSETGVCGTAAGTGALVFMEGATRRLTSRTFAIGAGSVVSFSVFAPVTSSTTDPCDGADTTTLTFEASTDGSAWQVLATFASPSFHAAFVPVVVPLPPGASVALRWASAGQVGFTDAWIIDEVVVSSADGLVPSGPLSQSIPGESVSEGVPSQSIDTPPVTTPATCTLGPCTTGDSLDTPDVPVSTPDVPVSTPDVPVVVPDTPVPRTCAPLDVVCVGPFTVPGVSETIPGQEETIPGQEETVPGQHVADVPAICDVANVACFDPQTIPGQHLGDTAPVTVSVDFTGLDASADPNAGELTSIGPFHVDVGPIPVDVCASTCPFPVTPDGATEGSLTVTVTIGGEEFTQTIPLGL